jgi:hypothetical protein
VVFDGKTTPPELTTVTLAVASGKFGRVPAWITAEPGAVPFTVKAAAVAPAASVTLAGTATMPLGTAESVTIKPPAGAGLLKLKLPFMVRDKPRVLDCSVIEILGGATLIVAAPELNPGADAVTLLRPIKSLVTTVMFAPVAFSGILTVAGTVATAMLLLDK